MAHKIIWTAKALTQLEGISDYISIDSVKHANLTVKRIIDSVDNLADFPRMGRMTPEENIDDSREILVFSWRVLYEIRGSDIYILSIIHGAQRRRG